MVLAAKITPTRELIVSPSGDPRSTSDRILNVPSEVSPLSPPFSLSIRAKSHAKSSPSAMLSLLAGIIENGAEGRGLVFASSLRIIKETFRTSNSSSRRATLKESVRFPFQKKKSKSANVVFFPLSYRFFFTFYWLAAYSSKNTVARWRKERNLSLDRKTKDTKIRDNLIFTWLKIFFQRRRNKTRNSSARNEDSSSSPSFFSFQHRTRIDPNESTRKSNLVTVKRKRAALNRATVGSAERQVVYQILLHIVWPCPLHVNFFLPPWKFIRTNSSFSSSFFLNKLGRLEAVRLSGTNETVLVFQSVYNRVYSTVWR